MAFPPPDLITETVSSNGPLRLPVTATFAPSFAKTMAVALPMPVPPPVISATLSFNLRVISYVILTKAYM
jgi:hypothetical protein